MALFQLQAPHDNSLFRLSMAQQLIGRGLGQWAEMDERNKQRNAMGQLLAGKQAALDPGVASLDIRKTQGGPAFTPKVQGLLETGNLTPQMAQAYMLQGGDPNALAGMMPKQPEAFTGKVGPGDTVFQGGRPVYTAPAEAKGPMSGIGRVMADFGLNPNNPADVQRASEIMKSASAGTNIELKVPPQYPAAPQGMHYSGDFSRPETVQLQPTPGYQPEISGPAAAAQALVPGALSEVQRLEGALFPQGQFDRMSAGTMNAPIIGAVPNTAGEGLRAAMQAGTMAILRHESGGAITDEEIQNKLSTYMPGPLDTPDVAQQKFARYKRDLESTYATASRGRGAPPPVPPAQTEPQQPGFADQLIQQGVGAVQGMMGGGQSPAEPQSPAIGEGTIATNPQTGQSLILRNGKWAPL